MTPHRYRTYIRATPDEVWRAITDPSFTRRYFFGTALRSSLEPGSGHRYVTDEGTGAVDGTIEVAEPPHRLVMTWHVLYSDALAAEPPSRVEWTITPAGDGLTRLDLVHSDLARSPLTWANVKDGWSWVLDGLKSVLETGEPLPPITEPAVDPDADDPTGSWHRAQAVEANNSIWPLLDAERTPADEEELLRRAYAAAYHWQRAAGRSPINEARALYMLGKAHLAAGLAERGLHYADACAAATAAADGEAADFDRAYAHELRARALWATGSHDAARLEWDAATAVRCADPDDQAILDADLATGLG